MLHIHIPHLRHHIHIVDDEWEEQKHPRKATGKFAPKGQGEASLPKKPQITSQSPSNASKQKHIDKLEQLAQAGEWAKVEAFPTPGTNTYSKMVAKYKQALLASHGTEAPTKAAPTKAAPAEAPKIADVYKEQLKDAGLNLVGTSPANGAALFSTEKQDKSVIVFPIDPSSGNSKWKIIPKGGAVVEGEGVWNLKAALKKEEAQAGPVEGPASPNPDIGKPLDLASMTKVGGQLGSTPGALYKDKSGKKYYVKHSESPERAKNELLAAALYGAVGTKTLTYHEVDQGGGKLGVATEWKEGGEKFSILDKNEAAEDFAAHAWLANWDAVGQDYDNLKSWGGERPTLLDTGGSLLFRAKGGLKGAAFGDTVEEWDTLRDPYKNKQTAIVFAGMTDDQLKESAGRVTSISDSQIRNLVDQHGPGTTAAKTQLAERLIKRRDDIKKRVAELGKTEKKTPSETLNHLTGIAPKPTAKEAASLAAYSGSLYTDVNDCLRFLADCSHINHEASLRSYLDKATIDENVTLWRGVSGQYSSKLRSLLNKRGVGARIEDRGFMSTSTHENVAKSFNVSGITFELEVPKGAKGASIKEHSHHAGESEILIQAGSHMIVMAWDADKQHAKVKLIQEHMEGWK